MCAFSLQSYSRVACMFRWLTMSTFGVLFGELLGDRVAEWLSHSAISKRFRVRIPVPPKVLGSDGIICKYLPL